MEIKILPTQYHSLGFTYPRPNPMEVISYCKLLQSSWGWQAFSYNSTYQAWVFSSPQIVEAILERFPEVRVSKEVKDLCGITELEQIAEEVKIKEMTSIKLAEDAPLTDEDVPGLKGGVSSLYPFQRTGIKFLIQSGARSLLADDPGCISGDEEIIINKGGAGFRIKLRDLYTKINEPGKWNTPVRTRSLSNDGMFKLNTIKRVISRGIKETLIISAITDEGGKYSIRCTADHRIATPSGWEEASSLVEGDEIIVNGETLRWCDVCREETPHALSEYLRKYRKKNYGKCKKCIIRFDRDNHSRWDGRKKEGKRGEYKDKDGYIQVSGLYFHPTILSSAKKSKGVYKHHLVYEAYMNDSSYGEWADACSHNKIPAGSFVVEGKTHCVHHKNGIKDDNRIGNLEYLSHREHAAIHGKEKIRHLREFIVPGYAKITSVRIAGETDVYDIQMAGDKNFIASGVVVHNCGKTVQAIGGILSSRSRRILVVCPATMKYVWESEIKKWSDLSSVVIDSSSAVSKIDSEVVIINYDLLKKFFTGLMETTFDMMILDESHFVKSGNAIRSRIVKALSRNIARIIMLTGTPVLNRPAELFNPLSILDPKTWNNYYRFVDRYCAAKRTRFGLDVSGSSNIEELSHKLGKYMLRRRKEDVLKDLPEKVRVEVPVELDKSSMRVYHKAYSDFARFLRENKGKKDDEIVRALQAEKLVRINALREVSAKGKIDSAKEIIENIIEGGEKIVVFSSFVAPIEELSGHFGERAVLITGKTDNEERFEIVKRFQEDPGVKVFLGGIKSAGVGITLTKASNVLFLDYSWTPADHKQAEDRAHRIGSAHSSISIYQLHAKGTMDDIMKKMLNKKRDVVEGLVGEGDDQSAIQMVLEEITKELTK